MIIKYSGSEKSHKPEWSKKSRPSETDKLDAGNAAAPEHPRSAKNKKAISIRLDTEILDYLQTLNGPWQTVVNSILLVWVRTQKAKGKSD